MKEPPANPRRVTVRSVGCKLNQVEAEEMLARFCGEGFVPADKGCDLCVVNTCTVTEKADRKSRNLVGRIHRDNPGAVVVITGCYATTDPEELRQAFPSSVIIPNTGKDRISGKACAAWLPGSAVSPPAADRPPRPTRARPFVKIQDGCDCRCSYCKVWIARGPSRSLASGQVLDQARLLADQGFAEIVLTGVNITDYRDGTIRLPGLLKRLRDLRLPLRYRLASLDPRQVDDELLEAVSDPSVCDHFHLSLQSGSDILLGRMNRAYTAGQVEKAVALLREARPGAGLGADVIVGFPGETEKLFAETEALVRSLEIPYLHVFHYSARKGTPAAGYADPVGAETMAERREILAELRRTLEFRFRKRFLGSVLEVVVEGRQGLASNFIAVDLPEQARRLRPQLVRARITGVRPDSTDCSLLKDSENNL
jgi:threonylcarbamoyladenosine tRNA methylthiotransferase MtaB